MKDNEFVPPEVLENPSEYIVPAQNSRGNSDRQWFRCQPEHARAMQIIVAEHKWPWKTQSDLIRWSVWRGIKFCQKQVRDNRMLASVTAQAEAMMDALRYQQEQAQYTLVFGEIEKTVNLMLMHKADSEAYKTVAKMYGYIQQMPNGYWKARYLGEIIKKYKHLLPQTAEIKGMKG